MFGLRSVAATVALCLFSAGCDLYFAAPPDAMTWNGFDAGGDAAPPPCAPGVDCGGPPVDPARYVRGSILPPFQLMPRAEYGKFTIDGASPGDADFELSQPPKTSLWARMAAISAQVSRARGATVQLIPAADEARAKLMPFRGHPHDVALAIVGGHERAFVPLAGGLMTPDNEVAVVDYTNLAQPVVTRVQVGVRPVAVAVAGGGAYRLAFVCNQYSNYISIIDVRTGTPLDGLTGKPVEIPTQYFCSDILLTDENPAAPDGNNFWLWAANEWRGSLLKYGVEIVRDPISGHVEDVHVTDPLHASPANQPADEITGVGHNPRRLSLSADGTAIFVTDGRGGEVARVEVATDQVTKKIAINAPSGDVVSAGKSIFITTTTIDRGLLSGDGALPAQVSANPVTVKGVDGNMHQVHPGALTDHTRAYGFSDVRDGLLQMDFQLEGKNEVYYTDDVSPEPTFTAGQKILAGGIPRAIIRDGAGDRLFVALAGSDLVQELKVKPGTTFELGKAGLFHTGKRPYALALDDGGHLLVADWGGETLDVFDAAKPGSAPLATIDLGYAKPTYPATNIERGQYLFYNTAWSNNGRKSCASCHYDDLISDGVGFSDGTVAPTAYRRVQPDWNLATTDAYFWNGSFRNDNQKSLAFAGQTRDNCELVLYGLVEGPRSGPATRKGDPNDRVTDPDFGGAGTNLHDIKCRPVIKAGDALPENLPAIRKIVADEKLNVADKMIRATTKRALGRAIGRDQVNRLVDWYSASELRLPADPLTYLYESGQLDSNIMVDIEGGKILFNGIAGCASCHDPIDSRAPFTDAANHGRGDDWDSLFIQRYGTRITIPAPMLGAAVPGSTPDDAPNVHLSPVDFFVPYCFTGDACLELDDPLAAAPGSAAETSRLNLIDELDLQDPDRGFVPGNPVGAGARVNTPSLRGIWWEANFLDTGYANTLREAILPPGHPALHARETGYAVTPDDRFDNHGATSSLSAEQVKELLLYVKTIQ